MPTWAKTAILTLAALLLGLAAAPPSRSQEVALEDFGGTWQFNRTRRDLRDLEEGIDRVADQLNIFIREIARGEMRRRIQPEGRVRFAIQSETRATIAVDDWGPHAFELGGAPRSVRGPNGDSIRVGLAFRNGQIVHRELHGQGHRTNVFALSPDGTQLTMNASIGSDQLPDQIRYRLTYRRLR
ncbi:MAG: hypothetical protein KF729_00665 [Sandaracinaceae bacterium]|nr:hypothetical protein [Sandaracinaceae bacterium]